MKHKTVEDLIQDEMNRCEHFTGILNYRCALRIPYDSVTGPHGIPCIKISPLFNINQRRNLCKDLTLPSREEAEAIIKKIKKQVVEDLTKLANSICPKCNVQVQHIQRGCSVYGTCGHRLYQGTADPNYTAKKGT